MSWLATLLSLVALGMLVALIPLAGPPSTIVAQAPPAPSGRILHTIVQDDDLSLFDPRALRRYMSVLGWLGVDEVRISAEWKLEARNPNSRQAPRNFDPLSPSAYTGDGMYLLDAAVRAAARAGLDVIVDPAFSAPLWATSARTRSTAGDRWYNTNIDVNAAAAWEAMLARRYSGRYVPPGQTTPLPRVGAFTLWNEPNQHAEITPQWRDGIPVSADWSRRLAQLAYPAIKQASPAATVLIGNTSDSGSDAQAGRGGVAPLTFIRRLACVDARLRPIDDGACAHFHTVPADGYAHHPYERDAPPWVASPRGTGWARMGDLPRLQALLDRLVAMHRLAPGAQNLWLTEQGYASNAQLPEVPWTEGQQAQLNAESEYLAWRDPQVSSVSQFLLRDTLTAETNALRVHSGNPRALIPGTWTTGLLREDFSPKPALWMFRSPVVARRIDAPPARAGGRRRAARVAGSVQMLEVWGRARPMRAPTVAQVEVAHAAAAFHVVKTRMTDERGIFDVRVALPTGSSDVAVRFRWRAPDGSWQISPSTVPVAFPVR